MAFRRPRGVSREWKWIPVFFLVAVGVGCGSSTPGESQPRDSGAGVGDSATERQADTGVTCPARQKPPTFAQDVKPFLDAYCNVCHSDHPRDGGLAPPAQNFGSYVGFKPWATESLGSMRRGGMPPTPDPAASDADICMLEAWINDGAQDN